MRIKMIPFKTYKQYNFYTSINGAKYQIHVRYNSYLDNYYLNIDRYVNGKFVNIINSIMLYTGFDLFSQHPQFNLGNCYVIPLKKELYPEDPKSSTIQNYIFFWISEN